MKKLFFLLAFAVVITVTGFAQAPQAFKYQAIAHDESGNILTNCQIGIRITMMKGALMQAGTLYRPGRESVLFTIRYSLHAYRYSYSTFGSQHSLFFIQLPEYVNPSH